MRDWRRLTRAQKALVAVAVALLTLYGGSKESGSATRPVINNAQVQQVSGIVEVNERSDDNASDSDVPLSVTPVSPVVAKGFAVTRAVAQTNGFFVSAAWTNGHFAAGTTLDWFSATNLFDYAWEWETSDVVNDATTNVSHLFTFQTTDSDDAGLASNATFFVKIDPRTCPSDLRDSDNDGLPDLYEWHHGTNPWIADATLASKTVVTSATDFASALTASEAYDVIELAEGEYDFNQAISIPTHPLLVAGSPTASVVIRSAASPAAFMLAGGQTSQTLFRDFRLVLDVTNQLQVGFWCGGSLPWQGVAASATFRNVHIRMPHANTSYYGWLFYRRHDDHATISQCSVNAAGAHGFVCGIYADNSQPIDVASCSFLNFPTNQNSGVARGLSLAETQLATSAMTTNETSVSLTDVLFDASFAAAVPLVREATETNYVIAATNCLTPSGFLAGHEPDVTNRCVVGDSGATWCGVPMESSLASTFGIGAFSPIAADSSVDSDGDGLSDHAEAYALGTDPWLSDSDFDGVDDAMEISQGTNPTDEFSFSCSLVVTVTNETAYAGATNYVAWSLSPTGWVANAVGAVTGLGGVLTNVNLAYSEGLYMKCYRDLNANGVYDADWDLLQTCAVPRKPAATIAFAFLDDDSDGDGMPDVWEWHHGLCMTNAADAFIDSDADGLINLRFATKGELAH